MKTSVLGVIGSDSFWQAMPDQALCVSVPELQTAMKYTYVFRVWTPQVESWTVSSLCWDTSDGSWRWSVGHRRYPAVLRALFELRCTKYMTAKAWKKVIGSWLPGVSSLRAFYMKPSHKFARSHRQAPTRPGTGLTDDMP
jgi:hypothetical protein